MVYDEYFTTAFGALHDDVFDATHWDNLMKLNSIARDVPDDSEWVTARKASKKVKEKLDVCKRVAQDLFDRFLDPDHVTPEVPPLPKDDDFVCKKSHSSTVPEGDELPEADETSESEGETTVSEGVKTRSQRKKLKIGSKQMKLRRSRRKRAQNLYQTAVCMFEPTETQVNGLPQHKTAQFLAGGNANHKTLDRLYEQARISGLNWDPAAMLSEAKTNDSYQILRDLIEKTPRGDWDPLALQAKSKDPDLPNYEEAMSGPHAKGYRLAAQKEVDTLIKMRVWDEVEREEWMQVLPGTWAFRRKVYPDGTTKKFKA